MCSAPCCISVQGMLGLSRDSYLRSSQVFNFTFLNRSGSHLMLLQDTSVTDHMPCPSQSKARDEHRNTAPLTAADACALRYLPRDPSDSRHAFGLYFPPEI